MSDPEAKVMLDAWFAHVAVCDGCPTHPSNPSGIHSIIGATPEPTTPEEEARE